MNYIRDHWQGLQPLKQSFWINLVLGLIIIYSIEYLLLLFLKTNVSLYIPIAITYFAIFHIVIFVWQALGTLRACDRNISQYISSGWTRTAQLAVLISFAAVLIWGLTLGQSIQRLKIEEQERFNEQNSPATYRLTIDDQILSIDGLLDQGITREVKKLLEENKITSFLFNSTGGNIYEARGLAKLIQDNEYLTHVNEACYSACTTAFIAGKQRTISKNAKLGFHQYKLDTNKLLHNSVDTELEQNKDLEYFLQKNIDKDFLQKAFSTPSDKMWFPTQQELIKTGVIHKVI